MAYSVLQAQQDTLTLSQVEINSAPAPEAFRMVLRSVQVIGPVQIQQAPVHSLHDLLQSYGGVDVRERGPMGVQADVGIRGGGMDQNLLLVNGVAVNDPQTGHNSLNIPLIWSSIKKVEVLEGPGSRWFGPNAFSGGINIITDIPSEPALAVDLTGGQYGLLMADASATLPVSTFSLQLGMSYHRSAGYAPDTDFDIMQVVSDNRLDLAAGQLKLYMGLMNKGAGSQSFYSAKYPDQYEKVNSRLALLSYEHEGKLPLRVNLSWRRLYDRFELFREGAGWYQYDDGYYIREGDTAGFPTGSGLIPYGGHNYHRTDVLSAELSSGFTSAVGVTRWGVGTRYESIISNVLGELMTDTINGENGAWYNHRASRQSQTMFVNHQVHRGNWVMAAGISVFHHSGYGWYWSPGADLGYFITPELKAYVNINQAIRLPTFTDLYYHGPDQISNPDLLPEEALTMEAGVNAFLSQWTLMATFYERRGKHLIDWIKYDPEEKWQSANLTSMVTHGLTLSAQYLQRDTDKGWITTMGIRYNYQYADKLNDEVISLYALDYLKHQLTANMGHRLWSQKWLLSWTAVWQERNGSYLDYQTGELRDYGDAFRVDARLSYTRKGVSPFVSVRNLLNSSWVDYGNVPQPGRWIMAGLHVDLL